MKPVSSTEGQRTLDGTVRVFLAEALILPAGLITTVVLTRRLGADGYGLFVLAATLVTWLEWTIAAVFARATYKCIAEVSDWRPVATMVLRLHLGVSAACAVLLAALSGPLAALLGEPALAAYLRLFAVDIPIFSLAHAHRHILVGTGGFRQRAWLSAARWTVRLVLILALVALGEFSVKGAIVASIGTSVIELGLARRFIRPALFGPTDFPAQRLWAAAVPLFLCALALRVIDKLDLFMLKTLGATAAQAGIYGVAQNLTVVPGIFAMSFAPLLLSTLTRLLRDGHEQHARAMARDAMRLVLLLLPLAGLSAGAAGEIVRLIAGPDFAAAGPLLAVLIFEALTGTLLSVTNAILTAAGRANWTFIIAAPLVPLALIGHLLMIPRFGSLGAAAVTTTLTVCGAAAAGVAVWLQWRVTLPVASVARSTVLCVVAYVLAAWWPAGGLLLVVKLAAVSMLVLVGFLVLGEFSRREIALAGSLVPGFKPAAPDQVRYWEHVGAEWQQSQPNKLWRTHSDAVNRAWLAAWWPERRVERVLKTDMFDEAVGEGVYRLLVSRARFVTGIDISLTTLRAARIGIGADVRQLPFGNGVFDVVVSNSTLDHFETAEELAGSLRELSRVLRPGGELLLTLDNPLNPLVAIRNLLPFALLHRLRLTPYQVGVTCGPARLRRMLRETGFEVGEVGALLHCPRVFAVRLAGGVQHSGNAARQQRFLTGLMKWERLAHWPTRWLTGYFVAVKAVRRSATEDDQARRS
jgi:O-antigen/teichoic acid export membrane protein/ubiquinone/menaquinone biosynthesis C-methylase UbiE